MPIYEYYCPDCRRRVSVFFRSLAAVGGVTCPECSGTRPERRFSRVVVRRGGRATLPDVEFGAESMKDDEFGERGGFADPRELARWARQMSAELGEPLDSELESALADIERGADP